MRLAFAGDGEPGLARAGLSRPADLEPAEPVVRYEREQQGE